MAIDSAPKRKSIAGITLMASGPGVTPDGTPGVEWRQQAGYGYSGIEVGEGEAESTPSQGGFGWRGFGRFGF